MERKGTKDLMERASFIRDRTSVVRDWGISKFPNHAAGPNDPSESFEFFDPKLSLKWSGQNLHMLLIVVHAFSLSMALLSEASGMGHDTPPLTWPS